MPTITLLTTETGSPLGKIKVPNNSHKTTVRMRRSLRWRQIPTSEEHDQQAAHAATKNCPSLCAQRKAEASSQPPSSIWLSNGGLTVGTDL